MALTDWILEIKSWNQANELLAAIHFGSSAKKIPKKTSDVDILLVYKNLPKKSWDRSLWLKPMDQALESQLSKLNSFQFYPSILAWEEKSFLKLHPLYLDFVDNSILLFDPQGIAKNTIQRTADWIKRRRAKKIFRGQLWYWDVNPNREPNFEWDFDK